MELIASELRQYLLPRWVESSRSLQGPFKQVPSKLDFTGGILIAGLLFALYHLPDTTQFNI